MQKQKKSSISLLCSFCAETVSCNCLSAVLQGHSMHIADIKLYFLESVYGNEGWAGKRFVLVTTIANFHVHPMVQFCCYVGKVA